LTALRSLRAVLFDLDGTLVDTEGLWWQVAESVAARHGHRLTSADAPDVLGRPVQHTAAHLHRLTGSPARDVGAELHHRFADVVARHLVPRPGALDLLDRVGAAGLRTALVSASPRDVVDLAVGGLLGARRFTVSVAAGETPRGKPFPDPYLAAVRALGLSPGECVAVEDTEVGVASAEAAGIRVLVVPSGAPIEAAPGRLVRPSLVGVTVADLVLNF
jgi:HAD superfamily hydrolase (TIGR01509 family)